MKKSLLIGGGLTLVVAGVAGWVAFVKIPQEVNAAIAHQIEALPPGINVAHGEVRVDLWRQVALINEVTFSVDEEHLDGAARIDGSARLVEVEFDLASGTSSAATSFDTTATIELSSSEKNILSSETITVAGLTPVEQLPAVLVPFEFDRMVLQNMTLVSPEEGTTLDVANIELDDFKNNIAGRLNVTEIVANHAERNSKINLDQFELINMPIVDPRAGPKQIQELVSPSGAKDFSGKLTEMKIEKEDEFASFALLEIKSSQSGSDEDGLPTNGAAELSLHDFKVKSDVNTGNVPWLKDNELLMNAFLRMETDTKAGTITLNRADIDVAEAGDLKVSAKLGGIREAVWRKLSMGDIETLDAKTELAPFLVLSEAKLTYTDKGILTATIEEKAAEMKLSPELFVQNMAFIFGRQLGAQKNPKAQAALNVLAEFAQAPQQNVLKLSMLPEKDILLSSLPMALIGGPDALMSALGASVELEPAKAN